MDNDKNLMLEGLLVKKKRLLEQLQIKAERCVSELNVRTFSSDGIRGIDILAAKQAMTELETAINEWHQTTEEVKKIEKQLCGNRG